MKKLVANIKNNWIVYIIILQPILDIISYFQSKYIGNSYSWILRILLLLIIFIVSFKHSKNKCKLILKLTPFALFFGLHIFNLYRIGQLNLLRDVEYFVLVFQMPVLCIILIDYIKSTKFDLEKIKKAIFYNLIIIAISILISYITGTYEKTYGDAGIIGWFSGSNTPSMILCALVPWALYILSNYKNIVFYIIGHITIFLLLYFNATKACYLTLLFSLFVIIFVLIFSKNENKKAQKLVVSTFFIMLAIFAYNFSFTFNRNTISNNVNQKYIDSIKSITDIQDEIDNIDFNNININDDELVLEILNVSSLYKDLIDIHGEKAVIDAMKPHLSSSALYDTRLAKVINAKIEFNNSDTLTKILGIGYSRIDANKLDLENDLQAIFYYYGYLGFALYAVFILYFIIKAAIVFFKNPSVIHDKEYIILLFLVALLIIGGEYSGAFLRKSNANIYLSLYLLLLYFNLQKYNEKKYTTKSTINKRKISFLLLHLGYGGIETATINNANALSKKYDVELISFYNLENNQNQYINKNISIRYLYNGGPNRKKFKKALKEKNIIKILKEGFKGINILVKKKILIKNEIVNSDSFAIISTRYDFSMLLSKYGKKDVIKIAQEHHHHNNNKKYINILKNKYSNIDYLFALTEGLKKDYTEFLKNNKHTKIVVVPNMLPNTNHPIASLDNKNIISIGRLDEGKCINELIEIFSKIDNKNSKLYIIGDGEEKEKLQQQIKNLHLENKIIMTGYLSKNEQEKYLLDSCLYAMTSISEGLPMVLLEAMDYGIPCIAYRTETGISDIIEDNKNGFIIDSRNKDFYIKKINCLLENSTKLKNLGNSAKEFSNKFKEDNILELWYKILNEE